MAKSAYPEKKRITHIGKTSNEPYGEESLDDCFDVFGLITDMTKGMNLVNTNNNSDLFQNNNTEYWNVPKTKSTQNSTVPSSNDNSQDIKKAALRLKKLTGTNKYPLMEKSQKILMQLKHNRSVLKPRAHLSSISPINYDTSFITPTTSQNKKKPSQQKEKVVKKKDLPVHNVLPKQKSQLKDIPINKPKTPGPNNAKQNSIENLKAIEKAVEKNYKVEAGVNLKCNYSLSKERKNIQHADDDTTGSDDYETFIQNSNNSIDKSKNLLSCKAKQNSAKSLKAVKKAIAKDDKFETDNAFLNSNSQSKVASTRKKQSSVNTTGNEHQSIQNNSNPINKPKNSRQSIAKQNSIKRLKATKKASEKDDVHLDNTSQSKESKKNESNGDTTDSDAYERFIQNNKVELEEVPKKKVLKKKKIPKRRSKRLKKNILSENLTDQYDSNFYDSSDDDSYRDECSKVTHVKPNSTINDAPETNSFQISKEAAEDSTICLKPVGCFDSISQENLIPDSCLSESNIHFSAETSGKHLEVVSNTNSTSLSKTDDSYVEESSSKINVTENEVFGKSFENNDQETKTTECKLASLDLSNSSTSKSSLQSLNCLKLNDQTPMKDVEIIELLSSDSEPESTEPALFLGLPQQNKKSDQIVKKSKNLSSTESNSEESDIEIIKVVPVCTCSISRSKNPVVLDTCKPKIEEIIDGSIKQSLTSMITTVNNIAEKVKSPQLDSMIVTNTPQITQACFDVKKVVKKESVEKELAENNNPVYITNICKQNNENGTNSIIKDENLKSSISSTSTSAKACPSIKNEDDTDDDIIIIESDAKCHAQSSPNSIVKKGYTEDGDIIVDFVSIKKEPRVEKTCISPTKHPNLKRNIESCSNSNIKSECSSNCKVPKHDNIRENQPALCQVDSSGENSLIKEAFSNSSFDDSNMQSLLELYKREFHMFQELKKTEVKLETSMKYMETQQVEKLKSIRGLIQNLVKSDPHFYKVCTPSFISNASQGCLSSNSFENTSVSKIQTSYQHEVNFHSSHDISSVNLSNQISSIVPVMSVKTEKDARPDVTRLEVLSPSVQISVECKSEPSENTQVSGLFGKKCDVCKKEAVAACQRCAKVFFCSNECGKLFWNNGHDKVCGK